MEVGSNPYMKPVNVRTAHKNKLMILKSLCLRRTLRCWGFM